MLVQNKFRFIFSFLLDVVILVTSSTFEIWLGILCGNMEFSFLLDKYKLKQI